MQSFGFNVAMMDWRGQGLSERAGNNQSLTHITDFDRYRMDIEEFTENIVAPRFPSPLFLMTHSMGGAPALTLLADGYDKFNAAVLCAPLTKLLMPKRTIIAAKALSSLAVAVGAGERRIPRGGDSPTTFDARALTHDEARHNRFVELRKAQPNAAVYGQTFSWLKEAFKTMATFHQPSHFAKMKTPTLLVSAGNDRLCDPDDHALLADASPFIKRILIAEARHEIMMERDDLRKEYFDAVSDFFKEYEK